MDIRNGHNHGHMAAHLLGVALGGQSQDVGAPGLYLHHVAHGLVKQRAIGAQGDDQSAVHNEGDGAVLQLAGGVSLRMDVGNLLQLQAALQGQSIVQIPADEEHILAPADLFSDFMDALSRFQNFLDILRHPLQIPNHFAVGLPVDGAENVAKIQAQHIQHGHLGAVGLSGGYGDLRAGPGVEHIVRLPGNGRAHHVHNGQNPCAPLLGLPQGSHGVQGLAGLADGDDQIPPLYNGVAVAELGSQHHLHAAPEHPLQVVLAHHTYMVRRATGDDNDASDVADLLRRHGQIL